MNIQNIKAYTENKSPYFFSRDTMRFFGQTLKSFKVIKLKADNSTYFRYFIISGSGKNWDCKQYTIREFIINKTDIYNSDLINIKDEELKNKLINIKY